MLLFIGHVPSTSQGREAFQEIDLAAMFAPIAKVVLQPNTADQVAIVTARAVALSVAGRPGPVVVVLPRDLTDGAVSQAAIPRPGHRQAVAPDGAALDQAARMIAAARRPLLLSGEIVAVQDASSALVALAEAMGAPVMTTYRRQDTFPNDHGAYAGHLEINRLPYQRQALEDADLLIAVGSRMDGISAEDGALPRQQQSLLQIYPDGEVLARCQPALPPAVGPGRRLPGPGATAGRAGRAQHRENFALARRIAPSLFEKQRTRRRYGAWRGGSIPDRGRSAAPGAARNRYPDRRRQLCPLDPPLLSLSPGP